MLTESRENEKSSHKSSRFRDFSEKLGKYNFSLIFSVLTNLLIMALFLGPVLTFY